MRKSCYSLHNVWTVKNHKKDIRNRRKKIWYDEDGNGSYYKRMQAYVQRNLKNTQNLDDKITKKDRKQENGTDRTEESECKKTV